MSNVIDLKKNTIGSSKFMQIYANCDFLFSEEIKTTKNIYSKNIPFYLILVLFKRTLFPEYILACAFSACIRCDTTIMAPTYY